MKRYDWIIVGGSFAGLATARQLTGWGLLIDQKPIGEHQTSACGTLLEVPMALGIDEAVVQVHHRLVLHIRGSEIDFPSPYPFCVVDYKTLCTRLAESGNFDFLLARVIRRDGNVVVTTQGEFEAEILVDASGWKAVLTPSTPQNNFYNTGVETVLPGSADGLHFFYEGKKTQRIYWIFPAGETLRVGAGCFFGRGAIKTPLFSFLRANALPEVNHGLHGNAFPFVLRDPVVDGVFRVGDAAGHCFALTGEGIRPAIYFGTLLGRILRRVVEGEITLNYAQHLYQDLVRKKRKAYRLLTTFQRTLTAIPDRVLAFASKMASSRSEYFLERYRRIFDFQHLDDILRG